MAYATSTRHSPVNFLENGARFLLASERYLFADHPFHGPSQVLTLAESSAFANAAGAAHHKLHQRRTMCAEVYSAGEFIDPPAFRDLSCSWGVNGLSHSACQEVRSLALYRMRSFCRACRRSQSSTTGGPKDLPGCRQGMLRAFVNV
jgi:hypothetical protein